MYSSPESSFTTGGDFNLPVDASVIIFVLTFLLICSLELFLGSPNGFSVIKIVAGIFFVAVMQYASKSANQPILAWTLLIVFFMTYFTITVVATSCAKFDMDQLIQLRNVGLVSPFVLSKEKLEVLRDDEDDEDDEEDKDD
jgi:hypothetical protein